MSADLLRRAADLIEGTAADLSPHRFYYGDTEAEARWAAMFDPQIAPPLAAWLRAEAACIDSTADVTEHMPRVLEGIEENVTGRPSRRYGVRVSMSTASEAVALARAILGE